MSREIKFRAWDFNKKEFFDPVGNTDLNHPAVMQFTGLKDKNGKEIYEGDVVKDWISDRVFDVRFSAGAFCLATTESPTFHFLHAPLASFNDLNHQSKLEVIGNIYENPEFKLAAE